MIFTGTGTGATRTMSVRRIRVLSRRRAGVSGVLAASGDRYTAGALVVLVLAELCGLLAAPGLDPAMLGGSATESVPVFQRPGGVAGSTASLTNLLFADSVNPAVVWAWIILAALLLFEAVMRVGVVVITPAQAQWWLPLPVSRRGVVLPGYLLSLGLTTVGVSVIAAVGSLAIYLGMVHAVPNAATIPGAFSVGAFVTVAALVGTVLVHTGAALSWLGGSRFRGAARAFTGWCRVALLCALSSGVMLRLGAAPALVPEGELVVPHQTWGSDRSVGLGHSTGVGRSAMAIGSVELWTALGIGAGLCAVLLVVVLLKLPEVPAARLRSAAGSIEGLASSALSMRAPSRVAAPRAPGGIGNRWSLRPGNRVIALIARLPMIRTKPAVRSLLETHTTVVARTPGLAVRLLTSALLPAAIVTVPYLNLKAVLALAVTVSCFVALSVLSNFTRGLRENPAGERQFPLSTTQLNRTLAVVPAVLFAAWLILLFGALHANGVASPWWLIGPLAAGLGWVTVATGSRSEADWSAPAVSTPMGAVPTGWLLFALRGPGLLVVVLMPTLIALGDGRWASVDEVAALVFAQCAVSGIAAVRAKVWQRRTDRGGQGGIPVGHRGLMIR